MLTITHPVSRKVLGYNKTQDYEEIVSNVLINYHKMLVNKLLKIYYLHFHMIFSSENLGSVSAELKNAVLVFIRI